MKSEPLNSKEQLIYNYGVEIRDRLDNFVNLSFRHRVTIVCFENAVVTCVGATDPGQSHPVNIFRAGGRAEKPINNIDGEAGYRCWFDLGVIKIRRPIADEFTDQQAHEDVVNLLETIVFMSEFDLN
jgi:hypothetical protein